VGKGHKPDLLPELEGEAAASDEIIRFKEGELQVKVGAPTQVLTYEERVQPPGPTDVGSRQAGRTSTDDHYVKHLAPFPVLGHASVVATTER
jgi:hypothetical protein